MSRPTLGTFNLTLLLLTGAAGSVAAAGDVHASESPSVKWELVGGPFAANQLAPNCIKVTATQGTGSSAQPAKDVKVTLTVTSGTSSVVTEKGDPLCCGAKTDDKGTAFFSLRVGPIDKPPVLTLTAEASDGAKITPNPTALEPPIISVQAELLGGPFGANQLASKCIKVTATEQTASPPPPTTPAPTPAAVPVKDFVVRATVTAGDATVLSDKGEPLTGGVTTDGTGTVYLSLKLGSADKPPTVMLLGLTSGGVPVEIFPNALFPKITGYAGSLLSDRVTSEVLLGFTLQNKYDTAGASQGFSDKRAIGQLTFDTLWPRKKSGSQWHTRAALLFSSTPLTCKDTSSTNSQAQTDQNCTTAPQSFTQVANSMTASISGIYQPSFLTIRSKSSHREGLPYDAFRLGLVFSAGFTTRDKVAPSDNPRTLTGQYGLGLVFTHNQTDASDDKDDVINRFPTRFVQAQAVRFDSYAGRPNTVRYVIDAGLRLPIIGSDTLPFYGGVQANLGPGPNDVRLYMAFIFDLAKLVSLTGLHQ